MRRRNNYYPQPLREPKQVQMVFKTDEIIKDIDTICNVIAESHDTTDAPSETTLTKDVAQGENMDLTMRAVEKTMLEAWRMLFPYAKTPLQRNLMDNSQTDVECYVLTLTFDYDRDQTQVEYLKTQIHEYVVKKCACDWLFYSMTPGQRVADTQTQQQKIFNEAEIAKGNIMTALAEPLEIRNHHIIPYFF